MLAMVRALIALSFLAISFNAAAFCGFYVGKADAKLFNEASQVVLVRDGDRTVISMLNDYKGDLTEFALVVPVPEVLQRGQINVGDAKIFDRIDAFTSPRLAEYYDDNPCMLYEMRRKSMEAPASPMASASGRADEASRDLGVSVEATYTVGEYDIVILSAKESDGLETWLLQNGYRIPAGASKALKPYIKQQLKFFVAKVNLKEQAKTGLNTLRPLQFAFESEKFMLPIRLGMVNASGPQDLIAYVLTKNGRVETTNYRTVKIPSNVELPLFVRGEFEKTYKAMFDEQAKKENHRAVFTEYFWDMSWCDPCAANPLTPEELRKAGVFWLDDLDEPFSTKRRPRVAPPQQGGAKAMVTRLHVRYTPSTFPEDLMFQETNDRENFQARYVLRHPWKGDPNECAEARRYFDSVKKRQALEAKTLASLTGWNIDDVRGRANLGPQSDAKWWERLWN